MPKRYTKKRKDSRGRTQVYDSTTMSWVYLSTLSMSDARSCDAIAFESSSASSSGFSSSSSSFDSGFDGGGF